MKSLIEHICDDLCRHPREIEDVDALQDICDSCRLIELANLEEKTAHGADNTEGGKDKIF